MKKKWNRFWMLAGMLFLLFGCIHLLFDWLQYHSALNSAPFSVWILVNTLYFGVPAAVCFLVGWILRKWGNIRKDDTQ